MLNRIRSFKPSPVFLVIGVGAIVKFALHLYIAPGYGFFFDELYTNALSRHLAFGYVDLPPLVPALVAFSRFMFGESLFAMHIVPALAGSFTLVFACLITKEFGGKTFAVALTALGFIAVPGWLMVDSIFCYDSIDQLILAVFLFHLVRFLRTGNKKLWIVLGLIAGLACLTKMTILFLGPGFLVALLASKYRRDLITPWPWMGAAFCLILVSPYILWQFANHWPTLEYWKIYGSQRVYQASIQQYIINILMYLSPLLLPLWLLGLYRIFRRLDGVPGDVVGGYICAAVLPPCHGSHDRRTFHPASCSRGCLCGRNYYAPALEELGDSHSRNIPAGRGSREYFFFPACNTAGYYASHYPPFSKSIYAA